MAIGPDFLGGQTGEDEDSTLGLGVSGVEEPGDFMSQLAVLQRRLGESQKRGADLRQQQLQQATDLLKNRRVGPSLAEQLFGLSAAFAQPTRSRGLGGVLANVMPQLGQTFSVRRQSQQAKEDALQELQNKYASGAIDDEQDSIKNQLALLRVGATAMKPKARRSAISPVDGRIYDLDTGETIGGTGSGGGGSAQTKSVGGRTYYKVNGEWFEVEGGQTGSPPSGGFRP